MVPLKRRKVVGINTGPGHSGDESPTKFPEVLLFLLERKMGASRRVFLSQLGRKKGFHVEEMFGESVTHVISENNSADEVRTWLDSQRRAQGQMSAHLLDVSWFTESMRAGHPVTILDRHKLQEQQNNKADAVVFSVPSFACQRRTTLDNHNTIITDALSLLAENAELSEEEGRGVAFRRAAAVLKALPEPVTRMTQLRGLPCLGEHSLKVIQDILENGESCEVESMKQSERYKALKVLTGVFGVGAKTADRWIREGIHTLHQLRDSGHELNRAQQAGVEHYDDLNQLVSIAEADAVGEIVEKAVASVLPGAQITLAGGFRRGKQTGHDVDFLITHPEEGREEGLMSKLVSWLESQGFLLYQTTSRNSYLESTSGPARPASNMDRFERCLSIFKLANVEGWGTNPTGTWRENGVQNLNTAEDSCSVGGDAKRNAEDSHPQKRKNLHSQSQSPTGEQRSHESGDDAGPEETEAAGHKPWRAVRVDLVVSPISQFAFALLGWTGSKLFERELRRWAGQEKAMSLNSHALFDTKQKRYLRATSEEEIFGHLGLEFIPPSERNA